jgi:hypothetical protein
MILHGYSPPSPEMTVFKSSAVKSAVVEGNLAAPDVRDRPAVISGISFGLPLS